MLRVNGFMEYRRAKKTFSVADRTECIVVEKTKIVLSPDLAVNASTYVLCSLFNKMAAEVIKSYQAQDVLH